MLGRESDGQWRWSVEESDDCPQITPAGEGLCLGPGLRCWPGRILTTGEVWKESSLRGSRSKGDSMNTTTRSRDLQGERLPHEAGLSGR